MEYLLKGKYIGPNQIKGARLSDRKTYLGKEIVEITYEPILNPTTNISYDQPKEEFPQEMVGKIVTEKQSDLTTLRDAFVKPIVEKIIMIMLEAEIQIVDIEYALAQTSNSLNVHLEKANEILWKKDLMKRTLADIQKILTKFIVSGNMK